MSKSPIDPISAAWAVIISELGYDAADPHLRDTPDRVARFMRAWHTRTIEAPQLTTFPNADESKRAPDPECPQLRGMLVTEKITFHSMCAHHGLPFIGTAVVGYIPGEKVLGLSKFARVIDYFAHRFQVQEKLTEQIANHLDAELSPRGVGVLTCAEHCCMSMRGVSKPGHQTTYSALRGLLFDDARARAEFMALATRS